MKHLTRDALGGGVLVLVASLELPFKVFEVLLLSYGQVLCFLVGYVSHLRQFVFCKVLVNSEKLLELSIEQKYADTFKTKEVGETFFCLC